MLVTPKSSLGKSLTMISCVSLFKALALTLSLICFTIQTKDIYIKFIEERTTITTETVPEPSILLPSIGICPGYKNGPIQDFLERGIDPWHFPTLFDSFPDNPNPTNSKEIKKWWSGMTYNTTEIFEQVLEIFVAPNGQKRKRHVEGRVVTSAMGDCFVFEIPLALVAKKDYVRINLKFQPGQHMGIFLFSRGTEHGSVLLKINCNG